jgi:hypothetical protein
MRNLYDKLLQAGNRRWLVFVFVLELSVVAYLLACFLTGRLR